jgi:hypothetical protein
MLPYPESVQTVVLCCVVLCCVVLCCVGSGFSVAASVPFLEQRYGPTYIIERNAQTNHFVTDFML